MPPDLDPELLELFYRSATDPALWQVALGRLVSKFRGDHAMLFTNRGAAFTTPFFESSGLGPGEVAGYTSSSLAIEAWAQFQAVMPPGKALPQQAIISDRDFERSDVYNEIVRPTNGFYAGFVQQDVADLSFHLAVCRPRKCGGFDDAEVAALQRWVPYLTGAMRLHQRLRSMAQRADALAAAIERLDYGAILCDANGRPMLVNRNAASLLDDGDGLMLAGNLLRASNQAMTTQLLAAILAASSLDFSATQTMQLPRKHPALPLLLEVMPVGRTAPAEGSRNISVAIFITEPGAPPKLSGEAIADVYHLTPREVEIASLLATGMNTEAISVKLALAVGTVRFNLKRVFEKTGARSQSALVALIRGFVCRVRR
jgi:DNA-binding CsgD family transcriptional regulator